MFLREANMLLGLYCVYMLRIKNINSMLESVVCVKSFKNMFAYV